jgi:nucleotide-binding universal stress UspA family protein
MDITTVYVPLDGSERAEGALRPAAAIAERCGANVAVLATSWPDASDETVERYLDASAAFLDLAAQPVFMRDRGPNEAICTAAAEPGALICMTTRGRGAVEGALLGSIGEAVVRTACKPVLLVGPAMDPKWKLRSQPLVIAGLDGSDYALAAAWDAGALAAALHGRVRAVEVVRPSDVATIGEYPGGDVARLEDVVTELRQQGVRADSDLVDAFDPASALAREAKRRVAAFISVATHGRTGMSRAVLGSVAVAIVRKAPCPVLVSGPGVHRHLADDER